MLTVFIADCLVFYCYATVFMLIVVHSAIVLSVFNAECYVLYS
jgi:hypothetical protein